MNLPYGILSRDKVCKTVQQDYSLNTFQYNINTGGCIMPSMTEIIRKQFAEGDKKRDEGLTTPEDVVRFDDIVYGEDPVWQVLDVYRPKGTEGKLPVIISVHGGAWVYGDKEVYQFYCMSLAQRGFTVVNFTYRLAPENKFPASLEDTNSVCGWVMRNADTYGFDTDRIFMVGDSAGAHNLTLYTCILTNPAYAAKYPFAVPEGFHVKAAALNCGIYQMVRSEKDTMMPAMMKDILPQGGTDEEMALLSGVSYITENFPPVFIMTSNEDFLNEQPELLTPVLKKLGIPFAYHFYGTKQNPLGHVFHCNIRLAEAALCNDEECAFFRKYM